MSEYTSKEHIVAFEKYCNTCKFKKQDSTEEPCCDCLESAVNWDSRKPIMWKEEGKYD